MISNIKEFINALNGSVIFDNGLIMAIIAINMTVIGLTSLADKKTIIGIDYGDFLIKEFKFIKLRMYYWLIIFALINVASLFIMVINDKSIRIINFIFIMASLVFAIVYFFSFILIENKLVVKQVHIKEILGLYCDSDDTEHFYVDTMVGMNPGTRTNKNLSTNIINYFSDYNSATQSDFENVFGTNSLIYSNEKSINKERKKQFNIKPYRYRVSNINPDIKDISFEFFKLFRFVDNQEKWVLDILRLFNGGEPSQYKNYDIFRLYNLARVTAQIRVFGISNGLFKYKFLFHYRFFWYETINILKAIEPIKDEEKNKIIELETEILKSLFTYISRTINIYNCDEFIEVVEKVLDEITNEDKYKGLLTIQEIYENIIKISLENDCKRLNDTIEKVLNKHISKTDKEKLINYVKLKEMIQDLETKKNLEDVSKIKLFS